MSRAALVLSLIAPVAWAQVPSGSPSPSPGDLLHALQPPSGWLAAQIDLALTDPVLNGAKVGVAVVDVDSGKPVYSRNEGGLFNPASNVKLFTTAAALAILGPEYRWKTVIYAEGPIA